MGEARLYYPWIPQGVGCVVSHPRDDRGAPGRISGLGLVVQVGGVVGAKPTLGDTVPGAENDHRGVRSVIGVVDRNRRSALPVEFFRFIYLEKRRSSRLQMVVVQRVLNLEGIGVARHHLWVH